MPCGREAQGKQLGQHGAPPVLAMQYSPRLIEVDLGVDRGDRDDRALRRARRRRDVSACAARPPGSGRRCRAGWWRGSGPSSRPRRRADRRARSTPTPALLTRQSRRPKASKAASTRGARGRRGRRCRPVRNAPWPPRPAMPASALGRSASRSRSGDHDVEARRPRARSALARPMPRRPPVTSAAGRSGWSTMAFSGVARAPRTCRGRRSACRPAKARAAFGDGQHRRRSRRPSRTRAARRPRRSQIVDGPDRCPRTGFRRDLSGRRAAGHPARPFQQRGLVRPCL